ncbi:MAG: c-type cytochrome [Burkholderiales bacterium]|nr:c-type cytochrome [Burkholderiales bacterium]
MAGVVAALLFGAAAALRAEPLVNPLTADDDTVKLGRKAWIASGCMACHGNNARGAVGPDLTDDEWLRAYSDEMVFNTIKRGRSGTAMSGFGDTLSDTQIWQLITWLQDENRKRKAGAK